MERLQTIVANVADEHQRIAELVNYACIRERRTQPGSAISGDAMPQECSSRIFSSKSERDIHGQSIHLKMAPALAY